MFSVNVGRGHYLYLWIMCVRTPALLEMSVRRQPNVHWAGRAPINSSAPCCVICAGFLLYTALAIFVSARVCCTIIRNSYTRSVTALYCCLLSTSLLFNYFTWYFMIWQILTWPFPNRFKTCSYEQDMCNARSCEHPCIFFKLDFLEHYFARDAETGAIGKISSRFLGGRSLSAGKYL